MDKLFRNLLIGAASISLAAIAMPSAVRAEKTSKFNYNPFQLVSLAEQGEFSQQNIPTYDSLPAAYQTGQVTGMELVKAAVETNRLPQSSLSDRAYINAVDNQLAHWRIDD
jgi:hypothetical protein